MLDIYSGAALEKPMRECSVCRTLPKVRFIEFTLVEPLLLGQQAYSGYARSSAESNIRTFAQMIKQMTPMSKKVSVRMSSPVASEFKFPVPLINSTVAQLSKHAAEMSYELHEFPHHYRPVAKLTEQPLFCDHGHP